jgi:ATP-dependent RNA circularization protein (DNA/RNA ligase family)
MTELKKYIHIERLGTNEVEGIEAGTCYVFPKLDGTNASAWIEDGAIQAGSRNRVLSSGADNAGFHAFAVQDVAVGDYLNKYPHHILYGEWLVPHSLKTYRDDAWQRFYVFDVFDKASGDFINYENYKDQVATSGLDYIAPIAIVRNGVTDHFLKCLDKNVHMIRDGEGVGEGVVIKNYSFHNKYGRVTWAKLITNAFKEDHHKAMGAPEIGGVVIEETIAREFVTTHLIDKSVAKITVENDGWTSKMIPRLLGMVYHDLITEELWEILKRHKNPKIDFATLHRFCIIQVKDTRNDLF